jgi:hypothetical protein
MCLFFQLKFVQFVYLSIFVAFSNTATVNCGCKLNRLKVQIIGRKRLLSSAMFRVCPFILYAEKKQGSREAARVCALLKLK